MKIGVSMSTCQFEFGPVVFGSGEIEENLKVLSDIGIDGVDLFCDEKSDRDIDKIRELFLSYEIEIPMYIPFFLNRIKLNLSHPDPEVRMNFLNIYKKQIDAAKRIGAKKMPVGFIRGEMAGGQEYKAYCNRLADSLQVLGEYGASRNVTLCIEPINRYEINVMNRVDQCVEFLEGYRLQYIKLLLDAFHMNIEDVSIEKAIRMAGDKLAHFHASDSNRLNPGAGHIDYHGLIETLKSVEYDGYLVMECFPGPSPHEVAKNGFEYLKKIIGTEG